MILIRNTQIICNNFGTKSKGRTRVRMGMVIGFLAGLKCRSLDSAHLRSKLANNTSYAISDSGDAPQARARAKNTSCSMTSYVLHMRMSRQN